MRLIFAGTPAVAVPSLRRLLESSRHEVVAVVTRPEAPAAGRGRKPPRLPVADLAKEAGIPVLNPRRATAPEFAAALREFRPDCCPVVAYGALLPATLLAIPRLGWVNLHFSLLPAWRGAAPVQAAIAAGDKFAGAATFLIEEGLDTGPVFGVLTERVGARDTAGALLGRLADSGAQLLERTIDGLEDGTVTAIPQAAEGVSYAPKVTAESARIQWEHPAQVIDRHIRSVTPAPGAWTLLGDARLKIAAALPHDGAAELPTLAPGVLEVRKSGVYAGTATVPLQLEQVQPQGKKVMRALDWARGARLAPGAVLA